MLKSIFNLLKSLGNGIKSIVEFITDFFEDIAYVVKLTGEFVAKIPSYFDWLPSEVLVLLITAFAVVVIYKVLGREG